eukprot:3941974-Rhodomonas_salina.8
MPLPGSTIGARFSLVLPRLWSYALAMRCPVLMWPISYASALLYLVLTAMQRAMPSLCAVQYCRQRIMLRTVRYCPALSGTDVRVCCYD